MPRMGHLEPSPDLTACRLGQSRRRHELPERDGGQVRLDLALVHLLIRWPVVPVPGLVGAPDFLRLAGAPPVRDGFLERLPGLAPNAVRMPTSRCLASPRTSNKLATLAQAISNTKPTDPNRRNIADCTSPTTCSCMPFKRMGWFSGWGPWRLGNSALQLAM